MSLRSSLLIVLFKSSLFPVCWIYLLLRCAEISHYNGGFINSCYLSLRYMQVNRNFYHFEVILFVSSNSLLPSFPLSDLTVMIPAISCLSISPSPQAAFVGIFPVYPSRRILCTSKHKHRYFSFISLYTWKYTRL